MLKDRKRLLETIAREARRTREMASHYAAFLAQYFATGDWFVTITLRDRPSQFEVNPAIPGHPRRYRVKKRCRQWNRSVKGMGKCHPDPRLKCWQPSSRYRKEPGPPVRDAALREIEHWLLELGWEAAGHSRQEIFNWLAAGKTAPQRRQLARFLCKRCLCCALERQRLDEQFSKLRTVATSTIAWVIAEEFGRIGGRWHVHMLVKGVSHIRRKKWWKRSFIRFGRTQIEAIHE